MYFGTISRFNTSRAYGFILSNSPLDGIADREIYFHRSGMPKGIASLEQGQRVEFVTVPPHVVGKPPQAKILRIIETVSEAA